MDQLQIVAEPRRRAILRLIWSDELTAGEIASHFDVSFSAVSQHLGLLRRVGFVTVRRDGNRRYYQADHGRMGSLAAAVEAMWETKLDQLAGLVEQGRA